MEKREFLMDRNPSIDLVQRAAAMGDSGARVSADLAAVLFPKSPISLTDRIVSNSRQYLQHLVHQIEAEICMIASEQFAINNPIILEIASDKKSCSYPVLEKAGLLSSETVLPHVFVKAQQTELTERLLQKVSQAELEKLLTRNLDHEDPAIADAAMGLLIAQSRSNTPDPSANMADLPAEILHELAWPVAAAIQKIAGYEGPHLANAAEKLCAEHDESASLGNRASRLAYLIEQSVNPASDIPHPLRDGIHLFLARLAHRSKLNDDQLVMFTAEPGMARFVVTLKALNIPKDEALSIFASLEAGGNILTAATYGEIDPEVAKAIVSKWSASPAMRDAERKISTALTDDRDL